MLQEKNKKNRILVTGATGFVGQALVPALLQQNYAVNCGQRNAPLESIRQAGCEYFVVGDFSKMPVWNEALNGVDCIVHLAARVHVMQETANDPLAEFRKENVDVTLALAKAAVKQKIKRFIYISTIKVNGEQTNTCAFTEKDQVSPDDPYARSKLEAEQGLMNLGRKSGMEIVIIRPVLVYGPGVKGNILRLLQLIEKGMPLPFSGVTNQRSMLALNNLVDLILLCIDHPEAANQVFLAADGDDISTEELIKICATAMHQSPRLFPISKILLTVMVRFSSRVRNLHQRLYGSLQVEISKAQTVLNWQPPTITKEGLTETVQWYLSRR